MDRKRILIRGCMLLLGIGLIVAAVVVYGTPLDHWVSRTLGVVGFLLVMGQYLWGTVAAVKRRNRLRAPDR